MIMQCEHKKKVKTLVSAKNQRDIYNDTAQWSMEA